ncbi:hypothetical protein FRC07_008694 [Ceratobasidium sp. 392]|nr:hypothetical protein FRC07_008694 [Ceratobasidium sp. 392]
MAALSSRPDLRHFAKGFTDLKQTTGTKHRHIQKVILGVSAGLVTNDVHNAMRATLDFIYYAQLRTHTTNTLVLLADALATWHSYKHVFVRLKVRDMSSYFRINKLHCMDHYPELIIKLGVPNGFNTELPKRLHIVTAKVPYKSTNHKNFLNQMCTYLTWCESLTQFDRFLKWATTPERMAFDISPVASAPVVAFTTVGVPPAILDVPSTLRGTVQAQWSLPRMFYNMTQLSLHYMYNATDFMPELNNYLRIRNPPPKAFPTSKTNILVYNQAILQLSNPFEDGVEDAVHTYPAGIIGELEETTVEGRFYTVLVRDDWVSDEEPKLLGINGFRIAQVQVIFILPEPFGVPEALAYVELFTVPHCEGPITNIGMHRSDATQCDAPPIPDLNHPARIQPTMQSDRSPPKKKQKYVPDRPQALSTPVMTLRANHSRSQSLPRVKNAASPVSATVRRATSVHPTPPQTTRKSSNSVTASQLAPIPAPVFCSDTKPRNPLKDVEDPKPSSSDETSSNSDNKSSSKSHASDSKSDSELKSTAQPAEAPTPIELNMSSSPAREQTRPKQDIKTSAELDNEIANLRAQIVARERARARLAESSSECTPTPFPKPSRATPVPAPNLSRATPAPKSSNRRSCLKAPVKAAVQVKESVVVVEEEEEEGLNGDREEVDGGTEAEEKEKVAKLTQQVLDCATGRHVLDVMKTLTGAAHTKDAKPPLFDAEKWPVYRSDDLIRPQWDLPFEENMKAWGTDYDNAVMDHSRIKGAHADHIRGLTSEQFCKILQCRTFATMVRLWKQAKEGKLDEWSNARKIAGHVANWKKGKAKIRKAGLEASGLDRDIFGKKKENIPMEAAC